MTRSPTQLHTLRPDLDRAVLALKSSDVVGMPTETVYGLAAAIDNDLGLKKIFAIKGRPFFDPLIIHVASFKQAQSLTSNWSPLADYISRKFWPGPLTLVLPKAPQVNPLITSGLETVGIRMPNHQMAIDLITRLGVPVAAPSANKFSKTSPTLAEHVRSSFPDIITLDGGPCDVGVESSVVRITEDKIEILRPGAITQEHLEAELRKWGQPVVLTRAVSSASPGHMEHHYMPEIPLVITKQGKSETALQKEASEKLGQKFTKVIRLELSDDPTLAARQLYNQLRIIANSGADLIFVEKKIEQATGMWEAIWDRLSRAATLDLSN